MAIKVTGKFTTTNSGDTYAVTDSEFNLGGHKEVLTLVDRDNIFQDRRREGMTCYVSSEQKTYQLISGITNSNWIDTGSVNETTLKYLLQQTDSNVMWGGESQVWTDEDENPLIFENKSQDEHIVDLYNQITGLTTDVEEIGVIYYYTFSELKTLQSMSKLVPGRKYGITDFQTIHTIPETTENWTGDIEVIIVEAETTNTIGKDASSESFPQDILRYDFDDVFTEDTSLSRPGKITYRKDTEKNISTYYDFRNVTYRRWRLTSNKSYDINTTYAKHDFVLDNGYLYRSIRDDNLKQGLTDNNWWIKFDNTFLIWTSDVNKLSSFAATLNINDISLSLSPSYYKTFGNLYYTENLNITKSTTQDYNNIVFQSHAKNCELIDCNDIHVTSDFEDNGVIYTMNKNSIYLIKNSIINSDFNNNLIGNSYYVDYGTIFQSNYIGYISGGEFGSYCNDNVIVAMQGNKFNDQFRWNFSTYSMTNNMSKGACDNNYFIASNHGNVFGLSFSNNELYESSYNDFGNFCRQNILWNFSNNKIGISFIYNETTNKTDKKEYNTIGNTFQYNIIVNKFTSNTFADNCTYNNFNHIIEYNEFKSTTQYNNIYANFSNNVCNSAFINNNCTGSTSSNSFGLFMLNDIVGSFSNNTLNGSSIQSNTFNSDFQRNYVQFSLNSSTFGISSENYFYGITNQSNNFGNYLEKNRFYSRVIGVTALDNFRMNIVNCEINSVNYSLSTHVYTPSGTFLTKNIMRSQSTTTPIVITYYDSTNTLVVVNHTS